MKLLEDRILNEGVVINNDILKVDSFINHQIDVSLVNSFADEVKEFFKEKQVDKVLTIETSGIPMAFAVAERFTNAPLVFAKKSKSAIVDDNVYKTEIKSFTRNMVSTVTVAKPYLKQGEHILVVDDFLAEGNAAIGLINMCKQAGAIVVGFATVIEKSFQGGRKRIEELNIPVYSGAIIKAFKNNKPIF